MANQANIMNRYFRLMQIEAGVFTEIIEIKPNGKEATKKKSDVRPQRLAPFLW